MIWMFVLLMSAAVAVVFALINVAARDPDGMDPMTRTVTAMLALATLAAIVALLAID